MHNIFLNYYDNPSGKYLEALGFSTCQLLIFKFQRYKYQSYLLHKNFIQNLQLPYLKPGWDYHCKLHCACVSVCARARTRSHECTCRYTCLDMCMSGKAMGQPQVSVLRTPSTLFQSRSFSWLETHRFSEAGWGMSPRDPPISTFPCCGSKCLLLHLSFLYGCQGCDSGFHACIAKHSTN